jgi:hypothetical protein
MQYKQITVEEGIDYFEELAIKVYSGTATREEEEEFWVMASVDTGK